MDKNETGVRELPRTAPGPDGGRGLHDCPTGIGDLAHDVCSERRKAEAHRKARHFIDHEKQFHLGLLPTEQSYPKAAGLGAAAQRVVCAIIVRSG